MFEKKLANFLEKKVNDLQMLANASSYGPYHQGYHAKVTEGVVNLVNKFMLGGNFQVKNYNDAINKFKNGMVKMNGDFWENFVKLFNYGWEKELSTDFVSSLTKKEMGEFSKIFIDYVQKNLSQKNTYGNEAAVNIWFKIEKEVDLSKEIESWKIIKGMIEKRYRKGSNQNLRILKSMCYLKDEISTKEIKLFVELESEKDPVFEKRYKKVLEEFSIELGEKSVKFNLEKNRVLKCEVNFEVGYLMQHYGMTRGDAELTLYSFFSLLSEEYGILEKSAIEPNGERAIIIGSNISSLEKNLNLFDEKLKLMWEIVDSLKGVRGESKKMMIKSGLAAHELTKKINNKVEKIEGGFVKKNKI